ncbi:LLM class flavin-dependent oxidoreductase [Asanoa iriomotensis]|uniref:Monooxygenase n=1 Tax=Asanoa iriomotensis TaxID=234613 RepID=A0ABQ4C0Z3_9ACTN|nr:LLM class flavin-dependent oxidoreductase [Asanoa iriomotensis]GIF56427.1 monooxygenase [Asanoa iriomotensis]
MMEVGIGLPSTVPGVTGARLLEWARRAEETGFASLSVLDRLAYDNYEPLITLAAAAAATERIRLTTTVLLGGYRSNGIAVLAKQLATLAHISGGRLVLGVGAGDRADDFEANGVPFRVRGRRLDALLTEMSRLWNGETALGPRPPGGTVPVLVGGHSPYAMHRAATYGSGWIAGGSSATPYPELVRRLHAIWAQHGRDDRPRLVSLGYACFGPDARAEAEAYLKPYYAHAGPHGARVLAGVLTEPAQLRDHLAKLAESGCDETILLPCTTDPAQVELIAKAIG